MGIKQTSIILAVLAIAVLGFVFVYFSGSNEPTVSNGLSVEAATGGSQIGTFLRQISAIRNISLEKTVFSNPVLNSLKDQSKEITAETKGRTNPFAPLGRQGASVSQAPETITIVRPVSIPTPTPVLSD